MTYFDAPGLHWLLGIEDTCVHPPAGSAMGQLDEHRLTGHDRHWRTDLRQVAALGATGLRYGVGWPRVHTAPGRFEWGELDERLDVAARELGLVVLADLVHYGTPTWLAGSFADPAYPEVVAEFAAAFAERYCGVVDHVTPLNEPLTTASFTGLRGVWPPALRGWDGWTTVVTSIAAGVQRTTAAVRAANPDAVVVHVEAAAIYEVADADDRQLVEHAQLLRDVAWLPTDLVLGRVGPAHPMHAWLLRHGADADRLAALTAAPAHVDVLGVNYYPDLTPRVLHRAGDGVRQVTANRWGAGLHAVLGGFGRRYGLPMAVTETSIEGDAASRRSWLQAAAATAHRVRAEGVDLRGLTWWPLLDFVDWSYASGGRNVEEFVLDAGADLDADQERYAEHDARVTPFLRRMGLLALVEGPDGDLGRVPTAAAAAFALAARAGAGPGHRSAAADDDEVAGPQGATA